MTDNEIRYEQGKQAVVDYVQQQSHLALSEGFNETYVKALCAAFSMPEMNWETPIAEIMYCAGVKCALDTIVRYYNDQLGEK